MLPIYEDLIGMVKLLLRHGADLSSYVAALTEHIDYLDLRIRGKHPDDVAGIDPSEYRWPPPVKDPKSKGMEYGRMFLAEVQRLILEHAKR